MAGPFKMKGMSFGNSPVKQDKSKKVKARATGPRFGHKKYSLGTKTNRKTGKTTYFKISGGSSTDGGKTFTPTVETKISESEYNTLKGN